MIFEPEQLILGSDPNVPETTTARIRFVDDLESQTPEWDVDQRTDGSLAIHNHQTDTTTLHLTADDTAVVAGLRVTDQISGPVHFGGEHTRLSGFDADDRHWVHAGDGPGSDQILAYERQTTGDYQLHVSEGDQTNRVLTQGDEGSLDAGTLDGHDSAAFVHADGSQALTAPWTVGDRLQDVASIRLEDTASDAIEWHQDEGDTGDYHLTAYDTAAGTETTALAATPSGDVDVPVGTLTQQGNAVLTTASDIGVTVENTDGTAVVETVDAIQAGTDLSFSNDGDDTATLSFTGTVPPASAAVGDHVTASGDDQQTTFTLPHSLGAVPDAPAVMPASRAASTDFEVTDQTASDVTIEYAAAPPAGTDNLEWYVITTASGLDAVTVSDDGATVLPNPADLNFGDGVTATDAGDGRVTITTDASLLARDEAETVSAPWQFDAGVTVPADQDVGFANASSTVQFAFAYDATEDEHVWADRANGATVATVDRTQTVDFAQTPTVNGEELTAGSDGSEESPATAVTNPTASGDGNTTTFALPHGLDTTPSGGVVQAASKPAMSDFYRSGLTDSDVIIQYHSPPPDGEGTDNLEYDVIVHE